MKKYAFEEPHFLGERMRALRLTYGAKQEEVAALLNVSRSTYSYYETGVTRPDPHVLGVLANFYRVPVSCFFQEVLDTTRRAARASPDEVGRLEPDEKALIHFLRLNEELSADKLLEKLEKKISETEGAAPPHATEKRPS